MARVIDRSYMGGGRSSLLLWLIGINIAVFLALRIVSVAGNIGGHDEWLNGVLRWIELPGNMQLFVTRPWTAVTYMFTQYDVFHILFNMLWLYWFGELFLTLGTERRMAILYLYGGIAGAAFYGLTSLIIPTGAAGALIGSSAAVLAIVIATAIMMPDFKVGLLLFGPVSIKWIAIFTLIFDLAGLGGNNMGGHISHIGGALAGVAYGLGMRSGYDITRPAAALGRLWKRLWYSGRNKITRRQTNQSATSPKDVAELDSILDKIKRSGYGALTARERKTLFEISSRIK